ncbi:hypothetical protein SBP02_15920 [Pseudomonas benzenivorans]|uniref:Uncharacterized protein n=1 Tax=Pseudomonas benzenivorans TaxID=556533 RepID=A0ABZ0PT24_9PSED|nr:hypothetical protein [Pseudomonas benzenivorans]WPC04246.1 hypothetical protein SBP02_15920 [Pseudomonas benzenivorans]
MIDKGCEPAFYRHPGRQAQTRRTAFVPAQRNIPLRLMQIFRIMLRLL